MKGRSILVNLSAPLEWVEMLEKMAEEARTTKADMIRRAVEFYSQCRGDCEACKEVSR